MTTIDRLRSQGQRLFANRGVVPFALLPLVALALPEAWRVQSTSSDAATRVWLIVSLAIGLSGLLIRAAALAFAPEGTSSRDTHRLRASSLNTTGMYSVVRNPLYLGNGLMWLGAVTSLGLWWLALLTALLYWLYIERVILVEEGFLEGSFGQQFVDWAARTPGFIPRFSRWRPPAGAFSWKRIAAEHNGLLAFLVTVTVFRVAVEMLVGGVSWSEWRADHTVLISGLAAAITLSVILVVIKQVTRAREG